MSLKNLKKFKERALAKRETTRDLGPCYKREKENCQNNGNRTYHCRTCEEIAGPAPDKGEVFSVQTCDEHDAEAQKKMKRHVLIKHPVNIARLTLAALKEEEI